MSDDGDCGGGGGGGDTGYSNDNSYTCNDTTTYENNSTTNVYSTNVDIDCGPTIENTYAESNFYIGGGCPTIYDSGFQPAPVYNVGIESISYGGGIQPCYDTDFHTIAVGVGDPYCMERPHVYPVYPTDTTVPTSACIFVFTVLTIMFIIFVIMGKFQYTPNNINQFLHIDNSFHMPFTFFCHFSFTLHLFINACVPLEWNFSPVLS